MELLVTRDKKGYKKFGWCWLDLTFNIDMAEGTVDAVIEQFKPYDTYHYSNYKNSGALVTNCK